MTYQEEITKAMNILGKNKNTIFIGQCVEYSGTSLFNTLKGVPKDKRIELPVCEEMQMGISIGLALEGFIPISVFPRWDFLILATNQLVNHLDKMEQMSCGQFKPKVIIRTSIGSVKPLFPGPQHNQDYTGAFIKILKNVNIVKLNKKEDILKEYKKAFKSNKSTILVEIPDNYDK